MSKDREATLEEIEMLREKYDAALGIHKEEPTLPKLDQTESTFMGGYIAALLACGFSTGTCVALVTEIDAEKRRVDHEGG